jgi:hypothetical protein
MKKQPKTPLDHILYGARVLIEEGQRYLSVLPPDSALKAARTSSALRYSSQLQANQAEAAAQMMLVLCAYDEAWDNPTDQELMDSLWQKLLKASAPYHDLFGEARSLLVGRRPSQRLQAEEMFRRGLLSDPEIAEVVGVHRQMVYLWSKTSKRHNFPWSSTAERDSHRDFRVVTALVRTGVTPSEACKLVGRNYFISTYLHSRPYYKEVWRAARKQGTRLKRCPYCDTWKERSEFPRGGTKPNGKMKLNGRCKPCNVTQVAKANARNYVLTPVVKSKYCPGCEVWLDASAFDQSRHQVTGLQGYCRSCMLDFGGRPKAGSTKLTGPRKRLVKSYLTDPRSFVPADRANDWDPADPIFKAEQRKLIEQRRHG